MGRKPKPAEVRALFFAARASGATLRQAVAAAGVSKTIGHYWLTPSGGVQPRQRRPRPALRLSLEEREAISRGLARRQTLTAIATQLGRSVSTISQEPALGRYVEDKLRLRWSPKQISRRLELEYPADQTMRVSAGVLRDDLHVVVCSKQSGVAD